MIDIVHMIFLLNYTRNYFFVNITHIFSISW